MFTFDGKRQFNRCLAYEWSNFADLWNLDRVRDYRRAGSPGVAWEQHRKFGKICGRLPSPLDRLRFAGSSTTHILVPCLAPGRGVRVTTVQSPLSYPEVWLCVPPAPALVKLAGAASKRKPRPSNY